MYFIVFIIGLIFSFQKNNKISFYFFLLVLLLLAFFRFGVGPDYFSYQYLYQLFLDNPIDEILYGVGNQEVLFRFLGSLSKRIGFSYQIYISLYAIFNLIFISKTVLRFSQKPLMSLFLYYSFFYFVWTFSGLRQGLALSVGVYYYLIAHEDNKISRFITVVIILSLIHTSALILLPLYFLSNLNWSQNKLILLSILSLTVSLLPLGSILSLVAQIPLFSQAGNYNPSNYTMFHWFDFQGLARLFFLIFSITYYKMFKKDYEKHKFIMNTFIISLNIYFILGFSELIAARLSIYGFYMIILIIPNIYFRYKSKINKFIFQIGILILSVLYISKELDAMQSNSHLILLNEELLPYTNIFNKYDDYYFDNRYLELNKK